MNGEVMFEKVAGKIHGGKRRNSQDRARSRAIESRSGRRSVRQELQPHPVELRGSGYVMDEGEE